MLRLCCILIVFAFSVGLDYEPAKQFMNVVSKAWCDYQRESQALESGEGSPGPESLQGELTLGCDHCSKTAVAPEVHSGCKDHIQCIVLNRQMPP